ncbi:MAG: nucleotidyltransferase family protein [Methylococcales bacterium]|nr:nucleotidyltransferase family protein [Methylococcales bacterium]
MKAMILAAGRGNRMKPLTDHTPKPLLEVQGKPLIQHTLENLVAAGFNDIVINIAYLGAQIRDFLGNGDQFGAKIVYSDEGAEGLETAGGIIKALPLLGTKPFLVINSDIIYDYPLKTLHYRLIDRAHLVLVKNPEFHQEGDFSLAENGHLSTAEINRHTFSGIGIYHPKLFENCAEGKLKLGPILKIAADNGRISGEHFTGLWMDIGTPERLQEVDEYFCDSLTH